MPTSDIRHLENMKLLEDELLAALGRGERTMRLELPIIGWLAILQEIKDRRPRNYSRLIADDAAERLNEAIERLHEECNFLVVHGPGAVAAGTPQRSRSKDIASPNLKRAMRDRNQPGREAP